MPLLTTLSFDDLLILWKFVLRNLDYDYISFQSLGLTQSNLMDLYLLSHSVVGAEVNFDNSKESGEGCAVNPSKSS